MATAPSVFSRALSRLVEYQHLLLILLSIFLISTSGWILMGRGIRANASIWDHLHVYLGLVATLLSLSFLLTNCVKGKWRQYFPWLVADTSQLKNDVVNLSRGKLPVAGGKGLFSWVEGLGMLLMVAVGVTGFIWFLLQGSSDALVWRSYHIMLAKGFIGFVVLHIIFACLHLLDFVRN